MAIPTSASYNKIIKGNGRKFHAGAHVILTSGTALDLDDRNIMVSSGVGIEDAVSESDEFQVGAAVINEITLKLNNFEGIFNDYDFKGAVITPWIGLTTAEHWRNGEIIEKIPKGVFTAEKSPAKNSIISLVADDNMAKFDVVYSKSTLKYPATLGAIATDVCSVCGVTLATTTFPNSTYLVASRPSETSITCREILSYVAQLAGCFARCNSSGAVEIKWYTEPATLFDVGEHATSYDVATYDTEITGVQIQGNDDSKTVYTSGTNGYAIRIKDNPLAQDNLQSLVNTLGEKFVGFKFRAYSASSLSNPAIEAGDIVNMTDKSGVVHKTFVSRLSYEFGEAEEFNADAETVTENQSERFTKAEKAQETADNAQQSADKANTGVEEAKAEITTANGQIALKASKANLISEINICPETIKIKSDRLEITGYVTFTDLESAGSTEINGANIKTGRIESEDGSWWLDLESGTFYLSGGTFAGEAKWKNSSGDEIGSITCGGQAGLVIQGPKVSIESSDLSLNAQESSEVYIKNLLIGNELNGVSLEDTYSGNVGIRMSNDTNRTLRFKNGLLVSNDG